jgi:hypothetical protein
VKVIPLYADTAVAHWHDWINCFIELCGNHRFGTDPRYGEVCERFRNGEPTDNDFDYVNERVFNVELPNGNWSNPGGPTIINVPSNTAYMTPTNQDRCAINDNVFAKHLEESQSKDVNVSPPKHTIIVRSDKVSYRVKNVNIHPWQCRQSLSFGRTALITRLLRTRERTAKSTGTLALSYIRMLQ